MLTYNVLTGFRHAKNVQNYKNIFLDFDPWLRHCASEVIQPDTELNWPKMAETKRARVWILSTYLISMMGVEDIRASAEVGPPRHAVTFLVLGLLLGR